LRDFLATDLTAFDEECPLSPRRSASSLRGLLVPPDEAAAVVRSRSTEGRGPANRELLDISAKLGLRFGEDWSVYVGVSFEVGVRWLLFDYLSGKSFSRLSAIRRSDGPLKKRHPKRIARLKD
jgi:hypothetical protein